ncbi:hypothetical protein C8F01DRAFT_1233877 [Mycena amicta]|nr:hypothetical protein C8F01DRAFT_1233877 [Mycena amicta]
MELKLSASCVDINSSRWERFPCRAPLLSPSPHTFYLSLFSMHFRNLSILLLALLSDVLAAPVSHDLDARSSTTACGDGNPSPCICNNAIGLRKKSLNCPAGAIVFTNPTSQTDGSVTQTTQKKVSNDGLQCDHIVELQFVADEIDDVPGICAHFQSAAGAADFETLFTLLNTGTSTKGNLILTDGKINNAKGIVIAGKNFKDTIQKAALGVANYLQLLETNGATYPGAGFATEIDDKMTTIMGAGNGFKAGFAGRYDTAVSKAITSAKKQAPKLSLTQKVRPKKPQTSAAAAKKANAKAAAAAKAQKAKLPKTPAAKKTPAKKPAAVKKPVVSGHAPDREDPYAGSETYAGPETRAKKGGPEAAGREKGYGARPETCGQKDGLKADREKACADPQTCGKEGGREAEEALSTHVASAKNPEDGETMWHLYFIMTTCCKFELMNVASDYSPEIHGDLLVSVPLLHQAPCRDSYHQSSSKPSWRTSKKIQTYALGRSYAELSSAPVSGVSFGNSVSHFDTYPSSAPPHLQRLTLQVIIRPIDWRALYAQSLNRKSLWVEPLALRVYRTGETFTSAVPKLDVHYVPFMITGILDGEALKHLEPERIAFVRFMRDALRSVVCDPNEEGGQVVAALGKLSFGKWETRSL